MSAFCFNLFQDNGVIARITLRPSDNNSLLCNKLEINVPSAIPINDIGFDSIVQEIKDSIESDFTYTDDHQIIIEHYYTDDDYELGYISDEYDDDDDDEIEEFKDFVAKSSPILVNNFASNDNINRKGPLSAADYGSLRQIAI